MNKENSNLHLEILAAALIAKRKKTGLSQREVQSETGVAASTISRIENQVGTPDADILRILADWLEIPLGRVIKNGKGDSVTFYSTESTPDIVAEHLRKDQNLSLEAANNLAELFRVAYEQMKIVQNAK